MAEFPALPLWTDAYLGDTTHLTTIEHGAYLLLLITAWRTNDCALPDDDRLLARYARCTGGQWRRLRPIMEPFFHVSNGQWRQLRLSEERKAVRQHRETQSKKGKAGAKAKLLKRQEREQTQANLGLSTSTTPAEAQDKLPTPTPLPLDKESNGAEALNSDQVFWANAKAFLATECRGDPGKLIGAWCRDYGKDACAHAITRAQLERPAQRVPFIIGSLKAAKQEADEWDVMP